MICYKDLVFYLYDQLTSNFSKYYDVANIKEGIFINISEYINYSILYLPFSLVSIIELLKNRKNKSLLFSLLIVTFLIVVTKFVFYKRVIIFLDVVLIILAGLGFSIFINKAYSSLQATYFKVMISLIIFLSSFMYFSAVIEVRPLLNEFEINAIISMRDSYPELKVFTSDPIYNSWLYGFSGHEVISPGWGEGDWGLRKWDKYWMVDDKGKQKMLAEFKQPLLIYSKQDEAMTKIGQNFYLFEYNN